MREFEYHQTGQESPESLIKHGALLSVHLNMTDEKGELLYDEDLRVRKRIVHGWEVVNLHYYNPNTHREEVRLVNPQNPQQDTSLPMDELLAIQRPAKHLDSAHDAGDELAASSAARMIKLTREDSLRDTFSDTEQAIRRRFDDGEEYYAEELQRAVSRLVEQLAANAGTLKSMVNILPSASGPDLAIIRDVMAYNKAQEEIGQGKVGVADPGIVFADKMDKQIGMITNLHDVQIGTTLKRVEEMVALVEDFKFKLNTIESQVDKNEENAAAGLRQRSPDAVDVSTSPKSTKLRHYIEGVKLPLEKVVDALEEVDEDFGDSMMHLEALLASMQELSHSVRGGEAPDSRLILDIQRQARLISNKESLNELAAKCRGVIEAVAKIPTRVTHIGPT